MSPNEIKALSKDGVSWYYQSLSWRFAVNFIKKDWSSNRSQYFPSPSFNETEVREVIRLMKLCEELRIEDLGYQSSWGLPNANLSVGCESTLVGVLRRGTSIH